jgi:hypothetical protein
VNRQILNYSYPITIVILVVFAWVVAQRLARGVDAIVPLAVAAAVVWPLGVFLFIAFWPRITVAGFRRAIVSRGFGSGPIPINTLDAVPDRPSRSASGESLLAVGADDLVYLGGWLDVKAGPRVLHVPDMDGRYYSLQFTDPSSGANFAYVGTRTTGTGAGEVPPLRADVDGQRAGRDDPDRDPASGRPRHRSGVRGR